MFLVLGFLAATAFVLAIPATFAILLILRSKTRKAQSSTAPLPADLPRPEPDDSDQPHPIILNIDYADLTTADLLEAARRARLRRDGVEVNTKL